MIQLVCQLGSLAVSLQHNPPNDLRGSRQANRRNVRLAVLRVSLLDSRVTYLVHSLAVDQVVNPLANRQRSRVESRLACQVVGHLDNPLSNRRVSPLANLPGNHLVFQLINPLDSQVVNLQHHPLLNLREYRQANHRNNHLAVLRVNLLGSRAAYQAGCQQEYLVASLLVNRQHSRVESRPVCRAASPLVNPQSNRQDSRLASLPGNHLMIQLLCLLGSLAVILQHNPLRNHRGSRQANHRNSLLAVLWVSLLDSRAAYQAGLPTGVPSGEPTGQPSTQPSGEPSGVPSGQPSGQPTEQPSGQPSSQPTGQPSSVPSYQPTGQPSGEPTTQPTTLPSGQPSEQPSAEPSGQPSEQPSGEPTAQPSSIPSGQPSEQPSSQPSSQPSRVPSGQPSGQPSGMPTSQPTSYPSSILQTQLTLQYDTCVRGVELYPFRSSVRNPYEDTVANSLTTPRLKLTTENVMVVEVDDAPTCGNTAVNSRTTLYSIETNNGGGTVLATTIPVLLVSFTIKFPMELTGYNTLETARSSITSQLSSSVRSGSFSVALRKRFIEMNPGMPVPNVTTFDIGESLTSEVQAVILNSASPTLSPTVAPTEADAQEYTLAFCSGIIILFGLVITILGAKWDVSRGVSGKSVKAVVPVAFSDYADILTTSLTVVKDAVPYSTGGDRSWASVLVHHRWLSGLYYLSHRPRYLRSGRLICMCAFQLLFLFLLLQYGPFDTDTDNSMFVWWLLTMCCIAAPVGSLLFGMFEYWLFTFCNYSSFSLPMPASTKILPSRSTGNLSGPQPRPWSVEFENAARSADPTSALSALLRAVSLYLSSLDSGDKYNLLCSSFGLSDSERQYRDYKVLRSPSLDSCTPLLILKELVLVRTRCDAMLRTVSRNSSSTRQMFPLLQTRHGMEMHHCQKRWKSS